MTDEQRIYEVPGSEATIGHGGDVYQVENHRIELPVAPWTAELEARGVVIPVEAPETALQESVSGVEIPDILVQAGFDTAESIRAASDDELLAVSGVGKATLAQIREEIG
jgi:hypothetical protein